MNKFQMLFLLSFTLGISQKLKEKNIIYNVTTFIGNIQQEILNNRRIYATFPYI